MGRATLPDFDAERPPELNGLALLTQVLSADPGVIPGKLRAQVSLSFGMRSRSRLRVSLRDGQGREIGDAGIVLARGSVLRGGAWIAQADDASPGYLVQVLAAEEDLIEVRVQARDSQPEDARLALLRAAYHLGNRHVPLQVATDHLKLEYDYVLVDMLVAMGLKVQRGFGPFEPEWGAYAAGLSHG